MSKSFLREMKKKQKEYDRIQNVNFKNSKNAQLFLNQSEAISVMVSLSSDDLRVFSDNNIIRVESKVSRASNYFNSAYFGSISNSKTANINKILNDFYNNRAFFSFERKRNNKLELNIKFEISEKTKSFLRKNMSFQFDDLIKNNFYYNYRIILRDCDKMIKNGEFLEITSVLLEEMTREEKEHVV